jgi:bifunctional non-homologous end joining protein LigD
MPEHVLPMLATLGELPASDDGWAYEMKWDGVRALVFVDGAAARNRVRIMSRNDRDVTISYPEMHGLADALGGRRVVLDGEIVTFDAQGIPSFGRLQQRMHVSSTTAAKALAASDPAVLLAFDVLYMDGTTLFDMPYLERRALLDELGLDGSAWQTPPAFHGSGAAAVKASVDQRLEGVVAKRVDSRYRPGRRSPEWVKIKNIRTQEVVVGGWRPGKGRRENMIGSLILGLPEGRNLRYVGQVGTGFTNKMLDELLARLSRMERSTSPFAPDLPRADSKDAHWVTPRLVGEVAFTEWTSDGRLRHPAWRGLRPDKTAGDVVLES